MTAFGGLLRRSRSALADQLAAVALGCGGFGRINTGGMSAALSAKGAKVDPTLRTGHILTFYAISEFARGRQCQRKSFVSVRSNPSEMRPVREGRKANAAYRTREHLTEVEMAKLLDALKRNRHGDRDRLIGLLIFRHGLRVSEACDLRWDDIDLSKRTIIVRRLKGSTDSSHYLEKDEHRR